MSKGLGQNIVIKFTEDLIGDVSGKSTATPYSFYRWYITSTWSSSGRLYLYELEFFSNGTKVNTNKIISMAGSSRYSSSYDVNRLFDGSVPGTEWDANGSLPHWVSIELDEAIVIDSFRWHTGTSGNKPKEFILQGSNDGINWVDIYKDESPNLNNWIDFDVAGIGNKIAFTVTGKEYQYVNGPLITKEYKIISVEKHPDYSDDKHLLITMHPQSRFNNVEGSLTVQYDQNQGSLRGRGGPVESFEVSFIPEDLVQKPNPHVVETITVKPEIIELQFLRVEYHDRFEQDIRITAMPSISVEFINVGEINP